ncbi:MAG: glycosyltransferase family 1 protein [Bacteroidota bacterium]
MKIVIDGRYMRPGQTGVGIFTENVVRELCDLGRSDEFVLIVGENPKQLIADNLQVVRYSLLSRRFVHRVWENTFLPIFLHRVRADIYFTPFFFLPLLTHRRFAQYSSKERNSSSRPRYVMTVHDLIPFVHPELATFRLRSRLWLFFPPSLRVADVIITDSIASKCDIARLFKFSENKIHVIALGKSKQFTLITDQALLARIREKYRLPRSFILFVGTIEPRKNLDVLFRAYGELPTSLRDTVKLVVVGGLGWQFDRMISSLKRRGLERDVHFTGYVAEEDLPALYNLATIFAYPSLYEGFGLPVLEAMACGLPVVVSNASSLPEVVGEAGIKFDPRNEKELARILEALLRDEGQREQRSRASLAQAQRFSWRTTAEQILNLFHSIYADKPVG